MLHSKVLVIEKDPTEKRHLMNELLNHHISVSLVFCDDEKHALEELENIQQNRPLKKIPKVILINHSQESLSFIKIIRSDVQYNKVKIYYLTDAEMQASISREMLTENKIAGLILKPLKFKSIENQSYVDSFSLYLDLINI